MPSIARGRSSAALATQQVHAEPMTGLGELERRGVRSRPLSTVAGRKASPWEDNPISGFIDTHTGRHHKIGEAWKFDADHPVLPTVALKDAGPNSWFTEATGENLGHAVAIHTNARGEKMLYVGTRPRKKRLQKRDPETPLLYLNLHPGGKFKGPKGQWFSEAEMLDYYERQVARLIEAGRPMHEVTRLVMAAGEMRFGDEFSSVVEAGLAEAALDRELEAEVSELVEAADSLAKASSPKPFSHSKTSNWVAKGGGLPPYIQHIAHALVKRGKSESQAIQMAIGIVKRWARGGGKVDANTRAAAAKAVAEWTALKAKAHAK